MKRYNREKSDDFKEDVIGNYFWFVLILTTFAFLADWFAPESLVDESFTIMAVAIGWLYVILDTLEVRRRNKRRQEEHEKDIEGGQSNEKS